MNIIRLIQIAIIQCYFLSRISCCLIECVQYEFMPNYEWCPAFNQIDNSVRLRIDNCKPEEGKCVDICNYSNSICHYNETRQYTIINPFHCMSKLKYLSITNSNIQVIENSAFSPLSVLRELDLSYNNISVLNKNLFRACKHLETLNLSHNALSTVSDVEENVIFASLKVLNISNNCLTTLNSPTLDGFDNLEILSIESNYIQDIAINTFHNHSKLIKLELFNNNIKIISEELFAKLINLNELDLSFNLISLIESHSFNNLQNLRILNLGNNKIYQIQNQLFNELLNLEVLNLEYNPIFKLGTNAITSLSNLLEITLPNSIVNIKSGAIQNLPNLEHLNIDAAYDKDQVIARQMNGYIEHDAFLNLINLNSLILSNLFATLNSDAISKCYKLKTITFVNIGLEKPVLKNQNLSNITINNCNIKTISELFNEIFISYLDISNNQIETLNAEVLSNISTLQYFNLSHNEIATIMPNTFTRFILLNILDLSANKLSMLNVKIFNGLRDLKELYLNGNQLSSVQYDVFTNLPVLNYLDLSNNDLTEITANANIKNELKLNIRLDHNRFHCAQLFNILETFYGTKVHVLQGMEERELSINGIQCTVETYHEDSQTNATNPN